MMMELENWARIAEMAGAIAVVVSVIYLAMQISANTKLLRSQAHYNAPSLAQRPLEMMVDNESLAGVVGLCDTNPNEVPAATRERCMNYYFMRFNSWESMCYQNLDDSIPKELCVGADSYSKSLVKTKPGYQRFRGEIEKAFDEPFRSYMTDEFRLKFTSPPPDR